MQHLKLKTPWTTAPELIDQRHVCERNREPLNNVLNGLQIPANHRDLIVCRAHGLRTWYVCVGIEHRLPWLPDERVGYSALKDFSRQIAPVLAAQWTLDRDP